MAKESYGTAARRDERGRRHLAPAQLLELLESTLARSGVLCREVQAECDESHGICVDAFWEAMAAIHVTATALGVYALLADVLSRFIAFVGF